MKSIATVLLCIALALLIDYLIESSWPKQDRANIVGAETDSVGGRYIYMSNGDIYHRRAESGSDGNGSSYNTSSSDNESDMSDWRGSTPKREPASEASPTHSRDRNSEGTP